MIDSRTVKEMIITLEAFRGRDPEDYYHYVEPLAEFVFKTGCYNLEVVNKLVKAFLDAKPATTTTEIESPVTAQFLADRIKPWVEEIRQRLFGTESAPFSSIKDAQMWCGEIDIEIEEWHKRIAEWEKRKDVWHAHFQAIYEQNPLLKEGIEKWQELRRQGIPVVLPSTTEFDELDRLKEEIDLIDTEFPKQIDERMKTHDTLWDEILKVVKATGFTAKSVEMYILADAPPVLPSYVLGILSETYSLPDGTSFLNRFARVTIRGELTFEDLRSLYRGIRQELGIKRSKRLTARHLQLYQMVQQRGAIPSGKGTVTPFWESVQREWNDLHPKYKYKTWEGVKVAHQRIVAQLERRITTKGGTT